MEPCITDHIHYQDSFEYTVEFTNAEGKFKAMVAAWLALPYKDVYKTHGGLYSIESRYLQTVQMHKVCEPWS